ncbi:MAG TPA: NAD(P)H-binding protein [Candidatus Limnocylindrales bacterium]|nr:NAD(P)H-binding protein [Candidatus Limnocylindrales bacterium]
MDRPALLLCGGTGALGGAIASHLHARGVPFRALLRPGTAAGTLESLASEIVRADFRDPASLPPALAGIVTVVTTVNAIGRLLDGARDISIRDVDDRGNANLIAAAEAAGVERFVYVSMLGDHAAAHTPFTDAKAATERRLQASPMREVVVRPDAFQEVWLGPAGGFDLAAGKVRIFGKGLTRRRHVAIDDVAEAVVRLSLADDPPRSIDLAGPEPMSASEAAVAYERAIGRPLKTSHVPRIVMRVGRTLLRPLKPEIASIMGMALASDLAATEVGDEGFRDLGVEPRPASAYIAEVAAARA